jgi:hypothetical protein
VESGGSIGTLRCDQQPLFRGEFPSFVNFLLRRHIAKLAEPALFMTVRREIAQSHCETGAGTGLTTKTVAQTRPHFMVMP